MTAQLIQLKSQSYDLQQWKQGYRSLKSEFDYWIDDIEGEIPAALNGTVFRNGPGMLDVNGERIQHPFDGDGMICAITFQNGKAHFRNRYVRTEGFKSEQKAGKILFRGVFGTQRSGGALKNAFDLKLKNIANTQVIYWGKKLLALWEAAEPHRLDPATLETLGLEFFSGKLGAGEPFAAHPWIDPSSKFDNGNPTLVNFSIKAGLSFTLTVYELNLVGEIIQQHSYPLPGFAFIHDFALTPNYCIFFQNPVAFNPVPFLLGFKGAGECIQFQPEKPTKMIPRDGKGQPEIYEMQAGFVFHHANAYETEAGLVVDSVCYESLAQVEPGADFLETDFSNLRPGQLWRFTADRTTKTVTPEMKLPRCCEFPSIHPALVGREYQYAYLGAAHTIDGTNAPLQGVSKINVMTGEEKLWSAAPAGFSGEALFVPRSQPDEATGQYLQVVGAEDEGWVIAMIYDGVKDKSAIVILDAQTMTQIARLNLTHHVPYGLHGTFTPEVFLD
jgi:all-trans-8'-apo-beta-carotenal 15,15'-oxygenase